MIVKTDLSGILDELESDKTGKFLATTTHKHYTPAMPARTKAYSTNITFKPFEYIHNMEYSVFVYNVNANYRTEINPYAMADYIEGYKQVAIPKIEKDITNYIERTLNG